jgi:hypothetical protein
MPRFYFDLREDGWFAPDGIGTDLPDVDAAEQEATEVAALIGRDRLPEGKNRTITVEVRNEHGQRILAATVALLVMRVDPHPAPPADDETRHFLSCVSCGEVVDLRDAAQVTHHTMLGHKPLGISRRG